MSNMHDSRTNPTEGGLLPVALFFVSVVALAKACMETFSDGPRVLVSFLGPAPTIIVLLGMIAIGAVWFMRGSVQWPFRKILALLVFALPLAGLLGTLQGDVAEPLVGGKAGANLAYAFLKMPAVLATGIAALLAMVATVMAWKLGVQGPAQPDSAALALAKALARQEDPDAPPLEGVKEEEPPIGEPIPSAASGEGDEAASEETPEHDEIVIQGADEEPEEEAPFQPEVPAEPVPAYLDETRVLAGALKPDVAIETPEALKGLQEGARAEADEAERRFREIEARELNPPTTPVPVEPLTRPVHEQAVPMTEPRVVKRPPAPDFEAETDLSAALGEDDAVEVAETDVPNPAALVMAQSTDEDQPAAMEAAASYEEDFGVETRDADVVTRGTAREGEEGFTAFAAAVAALEETSDAAELGDASDAEDEAGFLARARAEAEAEAEEAEFAEDEDLEADEELEEEDEDLEADEELEEEDEDLEADEELEDEDEDLEADEELEDEDEDLEADEELEDEDEDLEADEELEDEDEDLEADEELEDEDEDLEADEEFEEEDEDLEADEELEEEDEDLEADEELEDEDEDLEADEELEDEDLEADEELEDEDEDLEADEELETRGGLDQAPHEPQSVSATSEPPLDPETERVAAEALGDLDPDTLDWEALERATRPSEESPDPEVSTVPEPPVVATSSPATEAVVANTQGAVSPVVETAPETPRTKAPAASVRAEEAVESQASRSAAPAGRTGNEDDWAAWDDEPKRRRTGRRSAEPQEDDEVQPALFSHRSELDESLYASTVELVRSEDRCSVAMLQRSVGVSFSEATAIVERMYDEGIVGPQLPSGRREILANKNDLAGEAEA